MTTPRLLVHALSDSFSRLWPDLADEAGLALELVEQPAVFATRTDAVGLIAAGGEERRIATVLRAAGPPTMPVAAVGADPHRRLATEIVRAGASDCFVLGEDRDALRVWLGEQAAALRASAAGSAFAEGQARRYRFDGIFGESAALARTLARAEKVIPHGDVTVLITGETGTGKELLARAIHYNGPRARAPFVDVNCAAIPENLLESELFGHEKGAFRGASTMKPGLVEEAQGGTLFLDEIGELPLALQGKLLRVLQERQIRRIGGTRNIPVDVRIIAATHVHLCRDVDEGRFREDLYYRLNVVPLELPPLRDRRADIVPLARHFLAHFAREYGLVRTLGPGAETALLARTWPGNVRELRNCIERTVPLASREQLDADDFPADERTTPAATSPVLAEGRLPYPAPLRTIVRAAVDATLADCDGNKSESARRLGISLTRLLRILDAGEGGDDDGT